MPFKFKRTVFPDDVEYISPVIFSIFEGYRAEIFFFENKLDIESTFYGGNIPIHVNKNSIWNYEEEIDFIYVGFENNYQKAIFEKLEPKIIDTANFQQLSNRECINVNNLINAYITQKQIKKVGIMTNGSYYFDVTKFLSVEINKDIEKNHFFHFEDADLEFSFVVDSIRS